MSKLTKQEWKTDLAEVRKAVLYYGAIVNHLKKADRHLSDDSKPNSIKLDVMRYQYYLKEANLTFAKIEAYGVKQDWLKEKGLYK